MRNKLGRFIKGHKQSNSGKTWFKRGRKSTPREKFLLSQRSKGKKNYFYKGIGKIEIICSYCKKIFKDYKSNKRKFCSLRCRGKSLVGKLAPNWKTGYSFFSKTLRQTEEYKLWRIKVFSRDNFTCQVCGIVGSRLEAHHIKSLALFHKLAFDVNNGITLCRPCHKLTDSYGKQIHIQKVKEPADWRYT